MFLQLWLTRRKPAAAPPKLFLSSAFGTASVKGGAIGKALPNMDFIVSSCKE